MQEDIYLGDLLQEAHDLSNYIIAHALIRPRPNWNQSQNAPVGIERNRIQHDGRNFQEPALGKIKQEKRK